MLGVISALLVSYDRRLKYFGYLLTSSKQEKHQTLGWCPEITCNPLPVQQPDRRQRFLARALGTDLGSGTLSSRFCWIQLPYDCLFSYQICHCQNSLIWIALAFPAIACARVKDSLDGRLSVLFPASRNHPSPTVSEQESYHELIWEPGCQQEDWGKEGFAKGSVILHHVGEKNKSPRATLLSRQWNKTLLGQKLPGKVSSTRVRSWAYEITRDDVL